MLMIKSKFFLIFIIIFNCSAYAENSNSLKLNKLFNELRQTEDIKNANLIEKEIWKIWNKHPNNKKLTDKLEFGIELMYAGSFNYALNVFTNVIKSDPLWSEAWNKRATLLYFMKEYQKSLNDIEKVLNIEPRHFGALSGRAQIYIKLEKYQKAIDNLKKAKKIYPVISGNNTIKELEKRVKGLKI